MNHLIDLQSRLLDLHFPAVFDPAEHLLSWFTPELVAFFLDHATEYRPNHMRRYKGQPHSCHTNALHYAAMTPDTEAFMGFVSTDEPGVGPRWWHHSYVVDAYGTVHEAEPTVKLPSATYIGVPWRDAYSLVPKRGGSEMSPDELPAILQPRWHTIAT